MMLGLVKTQPLLTIEPKSQRRVRLKTGEVPLFHIEFHESIQGKEDTRPLNLEYPLVPEGTTKGDWSLIASFGESGALVKRRGEHIWCTPIIATQGILFAPPLCVRINPSSTESSEFASPLPEIMSRVWPDGGRHLAHTTSDAIFFWLACVQAGRCVSKIRRGEVVHPIKTTNKIYYTYVETKNVGSPEARSGAQTT